MTLVFLVTGGKGYYLAGAIRPAGRGRLHLGGPQPQHPPPGRGRRRAGCSRLPSPGPGWPPGAPGLDVRRLRSSAAQRRPSPRRSAGPSTPTRSGRSWPPPADQAPVVLHRQLRRGRRLRVVRRRRARLQRTQRLAELGAAARGTGPVPWSCSPRFRPAVDFTGCERATTLHNDVGIDNEEDGHGVWVCDGPIGSWSCVGTSVALRRVSPGIDLEGHVDAVAGPSGYLRAATPAPRPQRETPTLARRWHSAVPCERCRSLHLDEPYQTGGVVRVAAGVAGFVEADGRGADPQGHVSLQSRIRMGDANRRNEEAEVSRLECRPAADTPRHVDERLPCAARRLPCTPGPARRSARPPLGR